MTEKFAVGKKYANVHHAEFTCVFVAENGDAMMKHGNGSHRLFRPDLFLSFREVKKRETK